MFHNCLNKEVAHQIFLVFVLVLFSDYCWEIFEIFIYLTQYSKILTSTMEQKIFCMKTLYEIKPFKIVQAR